MVKNNVTTDVTDLFVIWPTHFFVICRTRMRYELADYTTMSTVGMFDRNDLPNTVIDNVQTGGFGSYIDFRAGYSRVCISHDYTDMITCWDLTRGRAAPVQNTIIKKFRTGWPIRSLTGYYESPHFAVCGRKWIKVFNTWIDNSALGDSTTFYTTHVALFEEGFNYSGVSSEDYGGSLLSNDFNHQIWDIIYINTRTYV